MELKNGQLAFLALLAIAQIIGWGGVGVLSVLGNNVAKDLNMPLAAVFSGPSLMFALIGVLSPLLRLPFQRFGVGAVMALGSGVGAVGLCILGVADSPSVFFAAWVLLGVAGAASLTTPAMVLVNQLAGAQSRRAIGLLALGTGLSGTVYLTLVAWLQDLGDWGSVTFVCAALMLIVSLPLHLF